MEGYFEDFLAAWIMHPSSSPAGAEFFPASVYLLPGSY
jgi:hypothetical protein